MSNDNKYKNQLENCYKIIGASDSSSKIVLLKGGSYKIKQYYLEDNVPRDRFLIYIDTYLNIVSFHSPLCQLYRKSFQP